MIIRVYPKWNMYIPKRNHASCMYQLVAGNEGRTWKGKLRQRGLNRSSVFAPSHSLRASPSGTINLSSELLQREKRERDVVYRMSTLLFDALASIWFEYNARFLCVALPPCALGRGKKHNQITLVMFVAKYALKLWALQNQLESETMETHLISNGWGANGQVLKQILPASLLLHIYYWERFGESAPTQGKRMHATLHA